MEDCVLRRDSQKLADRRDKSLQRFFRVLYAADFTIVFIAFHRSSLEMTTAHVA